MDRGCVYVYDSQPHAREALRELLIAQGRRVVAFEDGSALLRALDGRRYDRPDLIFLDVDDPGPGGLEGLRRLRASWPALAVVVMSAFATVKGAVAAMKLGALDYLVKPLLPEDVAAFVEPLVERNRLLAENQSLKAEIQRRFDPGQVVFASPAFRQVFEMAKRVAPSDACVLIQGESGTGKELIASTIHYSSGRANQRFLTVNCAALTETLLESQLFGHLKGAFTGAVAAQPGLVEEADGGTLFLDEIGDVSPGLQAKLLRVLQEKEFMPVGSTRARQADVRFVAATNKDLELEVAAGRFREDLYYRLNAVTLQVPPLRDRPEDVEPLARFLLAKRGARGQTLGAGTLERLQAYHWPGNVRELENVIAMAAVLSTGGEITPDHLPARLSRPPLAAAAAPEGAGETDPQWSLEELEARHIAQVLRATGYHKVNAARVLKISRTTLDRKIAQYGLQRAEPGDGR
ncbi:MAG: sigma-54-dependent transcriptional regulator [Deferrisomatales bacterium]